LHLLWPISAEQLCCPFICRLVAMPKFHYSNLVCDLVCEHILSKKSRRPVCTFFIFKKQESHAVARKRCDAAAVLFSLKFADNFHYKCKSMANLQTYRCKTEFNTKWPFKVTFWSQWKNDQGLSNTK